MAREAEVQNHSVETEELLNRVTSVQQERDLLQEVLESQVQEREHKRAEQEAEMEKLQTEVCYLYQVASSCQTVKLKV